MFTFPISHYSSTGGGTHFKTASYTGNGGTKSVTGIGFTPDLVMTKDKVSQAWNWQTSTLGTSESLKSNSNAADLTSLTDYITSFDGDGFTLGANALVNTNADVYKAFCWKKSSTFFDIVSYSGAASAQTINHNLAVVPEMIIVKRREATSNWAMYHSGLGNTIDINWNTGASPTTEAAWNNTDPTSSVFSVGTVAKTNALTGTYLAFLFASVVGKCKIGTYTGNGASPAGPVVTTGFQPSLVLIVRALAASDNITLTYGSTANLVMNNAGGEDTTNDVDLTGTGFQIKVGTNPFNASGETYLYAAWL